MGAGDDLSGCGAGRVRGRFAEVERYLTGGAQRPLEVAPQPPALDHRVDHAIALATGAERADVLAYLDRRIANAAAIAASTAPGHDTREIAGDRRRQMEVMRDEIAQGMHMGCAQVAGELAEQA